MHTPSLLFWEKGKHEPARECISGMRTVTTLGRIQTCPEKLRPPAAQWPSAGAAEVLLTWEAGYGFSGLVADSCLLKP